MQEQHGTFVFSILNVTDEYQLPFAISSETVQNTGIANITLTQEIDFETRTTYRFQVIMSYA